MLGPYDKSDLFVALTPPISGCEAVAIVYVPGVFPGRSITSTCKPRGPILFDEVIRDAYGLQFNRHPVHRTSRSTTACGRPSCRVPYAPSSSDWGTMPRVQCDRRPIVRSAAMAGRCQRRYGAERMFDGTYSLVSVNQDLPHDLDSLNRGNRLAGRPGDVRFDPDLLVALR